MAEWSLAMHKVVAVLDDYIDLGMDRVAAAEKILAALQHPVASSEAQAEEKLFGAAKRMARRMGAEFVLNERGHQMVAEEVAPSEAQLLREAAIELRQPARSEAPAAEQQDFHTRCRAEAVADPSHPDHTADQQEYTALADLLRVLKPFASAYEDQGDGDAFEDKHNLWEHPAALDLTVGDLRRAHRALRDLGRRA